MNTATLRSRKMWNVFLLGAAGLSILLIVSACGGGGDATSASSPDVAAGHELFKTTCGACHGMAGEGMPKLGKNLHDNAFVKGKSDAELVEFIILGRPATHPDNTRGVDMPPRGGNPAVTDEDLAKIVTYMRSLQ